MNKEMRDEITEGSEEMQEDGCDLIKMIKDLTLQEQEVDPEISFFDNTIDIVFGIQEMRENRLKELKGNISEKEKHISQLQLRKYECKECGSTLKDECTRLKENEETLKKQLNDACAIVESLEKDIKRLNEETRTSDEDAAILEKNRSLLWLYKNLTGVKWDYSVPSSGYAGSVLNSVNSYCKYFTYAAAEASSECVWGEIERAAHAVWSDISGDVPVA